ncbi:MAG: hypothetical protein H7143_09075 [Pseudorhodobacter sp.]|nr:hypothetical protein [Rhizobacter sp.]
MSAIASAPTVWIAVGNGRDDTHWVNKELEWPDFVARLRDVRRTAETFAAYEAMPKDQRVDAKDVGGYVGGKLKVDGRRGKNDIECRTLLTLDADHLTLPLNGVALDILLSGCAWAMHTSHSHSPSAPRQRLVIPLARPLSQAEYEPVSRKVTEMLGIEKFDRTTHEWNRLMFWPSASKNGEFLFDRQDGPWLDPDVILIKYADWRDPGFWPTHPGEPPAVSVSCEATKQDPHKAKGVVGAFCRAYGDIAQIIDEHLPDGTYEESEEHWRYTLVGATSSNGLVLYPYSSDLESPQFAYSHHESDPIGGRTVNGWDLVRLHRFRHLDAALDSESSEFAGPGAKPSEQAMRKYAFSLTPVLQELASCDEVETDWRANLAACQTLKDVESQVLPLIAHGRMTPISEREAVAEVCTRLKELKVAGAGVTAVRQTIQDLRKRATQSDSAETMNMEMSIVRRVLGDSFAGGKHLKRFGGGWWIYDAGVWRPTEQDYIENRVIESLKSIMAGGGPDAARLHNLIGQSRRGEFLNALATAVVGLLRREVAGEDAHSDPLNLRGRAEGSVINCTNGEIWFDSKGDFELEPHDSDHRLTSQIACAHESNATCPRFEAALRTVFKLCEEPEEMIRHWTEIMGTLIQPKRPEALWVLMKGPGGNGKTFITEVVEALMGRGACLKGSLSDVAAGRDGHFTASLVGKLMFFDDDLRADTMLPDDWLKKLSEEKILTANPKNAHTFEFTSRAVAVVLSNSWPHSRDVSHGIVRRSHVFETAYTIPPAERKAGEKDWIIGHELPGVLNLLVAGWQRVLLRGGYERPKECAESVERWRQQSNTSARFVGVLLERKPGAIAVRAATVHEAYKAWAKDAGLTDRWVLGRNAFYQSLKASGLCFATRRGIEYVEDVVLRLTAGEDTPDAKQFDDAALDAAEEDAQVVVSSFRTERSHFPPARDPSAPLM